MLNRWQALGRNTQIMAVALILWAVGEGLWLYIQPLYLSRLGASPAQIGLILSVSGLARLFVMLPSGLLADRYGARQMLVPGWLLGLVGVIIIAAAPNLYVVTVGYIFYGASAMAIPVINLYLVQSIEADQTVRQRLKPQEVLTYIHALFWLGVIVSPAAGGFLAETVSLRGVFWISAGWFGLSMVAVLRTQSYPPQSSTGPDSGRWFDRYLALLQQPRYRLLYAIFALGFVATLLGFTFAPKYLEDVHGLTEGRIGLLGSVLAAGSFAWNLFFSRRAAWPSFLSAMALTGSAFVLILLSGHWAIIGLAYLLMSAWEALRPIATGLMAEHTAADQQGAAFATVDTLHGLGMFLAPGIAGLVYGAGPFWPFVLGAGLVLPTFLAVGVFRRFERRQTRTPIKPSPLEPAPKG